MGYVELSDHRLLHMRAVAEECYKLAITKYNLSEDEARKAYMIGFLHDIGYAFSEKPEEHPKVGAELFRHCFNVEIPEIEKHGKPECVADGSTYLKILDEADLVTSSDGKRIGVKERINRIGERYGYNSRQYKNAVAVVTELKL